MSDFFDTTRHMTDQEALAWSGDFMRDDSLNEFERLQLIALRWRVDPVQYAVEKYRMTCLPYQIIAMLVVADSPVDVWDFYSDVIGENAYYEYKKLKILMPSGHGLGKTRILACLATWHRDTHPFSKTIITAPSLSQITGQLFGEFRKLRRRANATELGRIFEQDWTILTSTIVHNDTDNLDWGITGVTARPDQPESMQGAHALDDDDEFGVLSEIFNEDSSSKSTGGMMVIFEEASGVPDKIREVMEGALSEEGARLVAAGNPTRSDGWFADDLSKPNLYAVHPLDCRMSNNTVIYEIPYRDFGGQIHKLPIRGRVSPNYWGTILDEVDGDEDADRFRVRVRGVKPRSSFSQCIKTNWVEDALNRPASAGSRKDPVVVSIDFGMSSDKHALAVKHGWSFFEIEEWLPKDDPSQVTMQAARRAIDAVKTYRVRSNNVILIVDSNGVGRGASEYLHEYYKSDPQVHVYFFNAGEKALDTRRYYRHRDQMWHGEARKFFSDPRASLSPTPGLKLQLTSTSAYEDEQDKIKAESKKDIKKRTGQDSGNAADAVLAAIYATELVFVSHEIEEDKNDDPVHLHPAVEKHLKRLAEVEHSNYFVG